MYPDKFYDFGKATIVDNHTVKEWLNEIKVKLINANDGDSTFINSGDTFVAGFKNTDSYIFIVATSSGFKELKVFRDGNEINDIHF